MVKFISLNRLPCRDGEVLKGRCLFLFAATLSFNKRAVLALGLTFLSILQLCGAYATVGDRKILLFGSQVQLYLVLCPLFTYYPISVVAKSLSILLVLNIQNEKTS
jgi:hypothetical protein